MSFSPGKLPCSLQTALHACTSYGLSFLGTSKLGKSERMRPMNTYTSSLLNLAMLVSRNARMSTLRYGTSGSPRFRAPAMYSTDFTARKPQS